MDLQRPARVADWCGPLRVSLLLALLTLLSSANTHTQEIGISRTNEHSHTIANAHVDEYQLQPYAAGQHGPVISSHEEVARILARFPRTLSSESSAGNTNSSASEDTTQLPKTYESLKVNASMFQGRTSFIETVRLPTQAHLSLAWDPLRTVSFLEPGGIGGCPGGENTRDGRTRPSLTVSAEALHSRSVGCVVAMNAGFFNTRNGTCYGNFISRGRVVQLPGLYNANFGIREDGTLAIGYIPQSELNSTVNPFVQLIAGCIWLVRDGKSYVSESLMVENQGVEETGTLSYFASIQSARTAIGYGSDGIVRMIQVDGKTFQRGVNLWEFANLLISLNFTNAINLDGGGSAVSIINGSVASYPSDSCKPSDCDCTRFKNQTDCANYCKQFTCERAVTTVICMHNPLCNSGRGCGPRGTCVNGTCVCDSDEWGGISCETRLCNNGLGCGKNGTCVHGQCFCKKGWLGEACDQPDCNHGNGCSGHGACIQGNCTCFQGWRGSACEIPHPDRSVGPWQASTILLSILTAGLLVTSCMPRCQGQARKIIPHRNGSSTLPWRIGVTKYSRLNGNGGEVKLSDSPLDKDTEFAELSL